MLTFNKNEGEGAKGHGEHIHQKSSEKKLALFAMSDFDSNIGNNGANDELKRQDSGMAKLSDEIQPELDEDTQSKISLF